MFETLVYMCRCQHVGGALALSCTDLSTALHNYIAIWQIDCYMYMYINAINVNKLASATIFYALLQHMHYSIAVCICII